MIRPALDIAFTIDKFTTVARLRGKIIIGES